MVSPKSVPENCKTAWTLYLKTNQTENVRTEVEWSFPEGSLTAKSVLTFSLIHWTVLANTTGRNGFRNCIIVSASMSIPQASCTSGFVGTMFLGRDDLKPGMGNGRSRRANSQGWGSCRQDSHTNPLQPPGNGILEAIVIWGGC